MADPMTGQIHGHCDAQFALVREAFARNFRDHDELGAAISVTLHGRTVVDLWGGVRDPVTQAPWQDDTMVCMMSVAKGISAVALAMAHDRGLVDLDAPVAQYWPEFAAAGKQDVTVRQAGSHLAGVPVADSAPEGSFYDYETMKAAIAAQAPLWPPGTMQVYHSATIGHIIGAILEGATGKRVSQFLRDEISGKLGVDYFIGLTPSEIARCATMVPSANNLVSASKSAPHDSVEYRAFRPMPATEDFNSQQWRTAEIPAVNGHGTPRAVARIYGALANGGWEGLTLARPESITALATEQPRGSTENPGAYLRMGIGFMMNSPPIRPMGPNLQSFGFSGAGGAQAFADPVSGLGYCYGCNRMHDGRDIGPRAESLLNATFACL
jgi:CubicO group peptidase (beta-lactamase class C family)